MDEDCDSDHSVESMNLNLFFEDPHKDDTFPIHYISQDKKIDVSFIVKGVKRELGQTLDSTGLTMYAYFFYFPLTCYYIHYLMIYIVGVLPNIFVLI